MSILAVYIIIMGCIMPCKNVGLYIYIYIGRWGLGPFGAIIRGLIYIGGLGALELGYIGALYIMGLEGALGPWGLGHWVLRHQLGRT